MHTSFTLKMQSSVSIHGLLRKGSRVLPAPLMGEQEIPTRQLGKGIPGSSTILHCQKSTTEKAPEFGRLSSLFPLFIEKIPCAVEDPGESTVEPAMKEHARLEDRHTAVGGEARPDVWVCYFNETIRINV